MNRIASLKNQLVQSIDPVLYESNINKTHKENHFTYGLSVIPHPSKRAKGGEDSYYINENIIAIADGVGGWNDVGIDPAKYSRELCNNVKNNWENYSQKYIINPIELIIDAADQTKSQGSSTLVVITLDKTQAKLNTAYIGDSGYMIFSFKEATNIIRLIYESPEQTKGFNFPYQIGHIGDSPTSALPHTHDIEDLDIVVVGSDGLFDNVDKEMIQRMLQEHIDDSKKIKDIKTLCLELGNLSYKLSLDKNFDSPFARRAREYGYSFKGGKSDDITIAVGQINLIKAKIEL